MQLGSIPYAEPHRRGGEQRRHQMSKLDKLIDQARVHLEPGEAIRSAVLGTYAAKVMGSETVRAGILLATDRRVVFYAKKVTGYELESFPYGNISSFEQGKNMMGHNVTFHASGNRVHVKWIPADNNFAAFTQQVNAAMSGAYQPTPAPTAPTAPTATMAGQPPPPPPGYQPRPEFDPPSYSAAASRSAEGEASAMAVDRCRGGGGDRHWLSRQRAAGQGRGWLLRSEPDHGVFHRRVQRRSDDQPGADDAAASCSDDHAGACTSARAGPVARSGERAAAGRGLPRLHVLLTRRA